MSKATQLPLPNEAVARLHQTYQIITGIDLPKALHREYQWSLWLAKGWTEADLRLVVGYLKRQYKDFWLKMVRFSRLIEDHAGFEEWLAMAKADQRNQRPPMSTKAAALRAVGRNEPEANAEPRKAEVVAHEILKAGYERLKKEVEL